MYRIYFDVETFTQGQADFPPIQDALIVLQRLPDGQWATEWGGEFYIWRWGQWSGVSREGLRRWLTAQDLLRTRIGDIHEVYLDGEWFSVDYFGFLEWLEHEQHALIGQMTTDENWNLLMATVLADKHYAEEHGMLPD